MIVSPETSDLFTASGKVRHGFFGRRGGVSIGDFASLNASTSTGDDAEAVAQNRRIAADSLGGGPLVVLKQIHSTRVITIEAGALPAPGTEADALVTRHPNILLGVLTADCAPLLLLDPYAGVIGAAHAGWSGAVHGILENTVAAMEVLGAQRSRIDLEIGPTISGENYEVGEEFKANAIALNPNAEMDFFTPESGVPHFDLPGFLRREAERIGLVSVGDLERCTYAAPDRYFSHRYATHQASRTGRQISVIGLA